VINFTLQRFIPKKEPLISVETEDGWAAEPVWTYDEINNKYHQKLNNFSNM
jgi:hypothetical protein